MEKVIPVMLELLAQRNQVHTILCGPSSVDRMWEGRLPNISVGPMKVGHHNFRRTILPTLVFLRHELRRIRPDVVVTTAPLLVAMLACVRLELRYKVVSWIHDNPPRPRGWAAPDMLLLRLAWGHLTITEGAAADFVNAGLRNVHAISYPLDCNEFTDRSLIPRPAGPAEFVYIGKISRPHKRIDRIVHALQEIEDLDSWHLTIVGDGPDREWLQKALEEGEQASRVTWHKWSSRPWDLVKEASAFLFTSEHEGLGIVLVEALSHGVPIVAMDCNHGPREVVTENVSGWVVPSNDSESFAAILRSLVTGQRLLPLPADVQQSLGTHYSPETVAIRMEEALAPFDRFPQGSPIPHGTRKNSH